MLEHDSTLVERCLSGDQGAWGALVDRYSGLVYAVARKSRLPPEICDDVAQIVFATFARQLAGIRDRESLAGWFGVVARREAWRARRTRQTLAERESGLEIDPAEPHGRDEELLERAAEVRAAVAGLTSPCRELIQWMFFSDPAPDYAAVAAKLGIAVGSIGPTRRRCLARLLRVLEGAEPSKG
ncbi:MAG: sigma-70 family RNA polymerase sigma factor [Planctomycetia bacterium]|nr:MAG: sigma-70 family RNA polymerase sigma factor [Planctomycetia bacterium]